MAIPDMFLKQLRIKSGIPLNKDDAGTEFEPFYDADTMSFILDEASITHSNKPFMDNLSSLPFIFLLARREIYTILAGAFAKSYDIGSRDGNLKKSQPTQQYLALIKQIDATYALFMKNSNVKMAAVLLSNKSKYTYRNYLNAPAPNMNVHIEDNNSEELTFKVSNMTNVDIITFDIYISDYPIYDMFELPPINPTSTLLQSKTPYTNNTYRIDKKGANPQYVGLLSRNKYGRQYFLEKFIGLDSSTEETGDSV